MYGYLRESMTVYDTLARRKVFRKDFLIIIFKT